MGSGKADKANDRIILVRCGNAMALQSALKTEGVQIPAGTPAERIMLAAVKSEFAEELPDDARWRRELLLARHAVRRAKKPG